MAQSHNRSVQRIDRRRLLQGMGAAGMVGVAGCLGGNGDDEDGETGDDASRLEDIEEPEVDFADLQEGGTLTIGVTETVDLFDPPYTTGANSTQAHVFIFETLTTTDREGNIYPWLAEEYEEVEVQDIDRTAYEDYMISVPVGDEGIPETDEQVVVQHPEDDPEDGEVRVLTPEEASAAVDDGVFGMQFRYTLREGIQFHDGEELTAENVVLTAERYENSDLSAQTYDSLLHAREVDEYTVDLFAQIPDAEAERELPGLYIHSTEQAQLGDGELDPREGNNPVGTGPYVLEEFEDEDYYELSKFDGYWVEEMGVDSIDWFDGPEEFPDGPVIDEIVAEIIPDDSSRAAALQSGEIDVTSDLTSSTLDDFFDSDEYNITGVEAGGYTYIQYPLHVEPWDDNRIRQAVNHLVPREQIVENIFYGWARPAWTDLPELAEENGTADGEALDETIRPYNEYDPERAAELLDEAGEDLGIEYPLEIQLETNADNTDRVAMVELIADSMEQSEYFETSVETYEFNTWSERWQDTSYIEEGHISCVGLSGTFNPESFCNALHHSDNHGQCCNMQGISDPELDELMDSARYDIEMVEDENVRAERYDEVWEYLAEERYSSIMLFELTEAVMNTDVIGFRADPFTETLYSFALYSPVESQAIWLDRDE